MLLRLVLSTDVACGLAAASDQPLQVLNTTPRTMQACNQLALQNAVNSTRQQKLMQQNVMAGGINYPYVLGHDQSKVMTRTIAKAKDQAPNGCAIPLTREHRSPDTRFELHAGPSPKFASTL
jgi:hypothetical protein